MERKSCAWAVTDPLLVAYHDSEWGLPVRDGRELLEHLILDGAQAGLSWLTVLRKREGYRRAFEGFDPARVARFSRRKIDAVLRDPGIIRNRAKVEAAVANCRAYQALIEAGSGRPTDFAEFLWSFVGGEPKVNRRRRLADLPAETPRSRAMSKALKSRGFRFVGPTICYAFMQAVGMVNDHVVSCFRHQEVGR